MTLSEWRELAQIVQSVVTVIAIVAGGFWGYWLFVKNRQRYPRAQIEHTIFHSAIADNKLLLHVIVTVTNPGNVLLSLVSLDARVQRILPASSEFVESIGKGIDPVAEGKSEIEWPLIGSREIDLRKDRYEIEPGESQGIDCEFVLADNVELVAIYTYLKNVSKRGREIGWDLTTVYSLSESEGSTK